MQNLSEKTTQLSMAARQAASRLDWATVHSAASEILREDEYSPEGHFLLGLVEKASQKPVRAREAFQTALDLDQNRHDAAIELADQLVMARRYGEAQALVEKYKTNIQNSPRYLDMAGTVLTYIGLNEEAWPLYQRATELQPEIEHFQANLASCGVFVGRIDESRKIYEQMLAKRPTHQRNHYHISRLEKAKDETHIQQMLTVLGTESKLPEQNIYMYYAIGKEYEDLENWDKAFEFYEKAGNAVAGVANYSFDVDQALLEKIESACSKEWLTRDPMSKQTEVVGKTPCFILGLPRTGTTLTERIISSHSDVQSLGETEFIEFALRAEGGIETTDKMNTEIIDAVADVDIARIANNYLNNVAYELGDESIFIDKLPYNFQYVGFIAKAFPDAKIIHLTRHPLDACFAMYKQVFTWPYKFSYTLENLGKFYVAYLKIMDHWRKVLGDRLIEISYEDLVSDQENQTRMLLDKLGLDFEEACLNFEKNQAASTTASSVQVREKMHTRSMNRWKHYERQLEPLKSYLQDHGVPLDEG